MRIKLNLRHNLMIVLIFLYLFYVIFYQYAIGEVNGLLTGIGVGMLILNIISPTIKDSIYKAWWMVIFIVVALISGTLFGINSNLFFDLLGRIIKYMIPMFSIYIYIDNKKEYLTRVMIAVWLSALLLSIYSFLNGSAQMYYGGMTVGELNKNIMSCYITLGFFANVYLLLVTKNKIFSIALLLSMATEILSQLNAASRTGVVSVLVLLLAYIHTVYYIKNQYKLLRKIAIIVVVLALICWFMLSFTKLSDSFVVFERLQGKYVTGDRLRKYYQEVAWNLFLSNPLLGKGFGAVSSEAGNLAHSFYYETLASTGLIGLSLLALPLAKCGYTFFVISRKKSESTENRLITRMMSWSILLFFITGISLVYIYNTFFYVYIGIWFGALRMIAFNGDSALLKSDINFQ